MEALSLQIWLQEEEEEMFWQLLHSQEGKRPSQRQVQVPLGLFPPGVCVEELGVSQGEGRSCS